MPSPSADIKPSPEIAVEPSPETFPGDPWPSPVVKPSPEIGVEPSPVTFPVDPSDSSLGAPDVSTVEDPSRTGSGDGSGTAAGDGMATGAGDGMATGTGDGMATGTGDGMATGTGDGSGTAAGSGDGMATGTADSSVTGAEESDAVDREVTDEVVDGAEEQKVEEGASTEEREDTGDSSDGTGDEEEEEEEAPPALLAQRTAIPTIAALQNATGVLEQSMAWGVKAGSDLKAALMLKTKMPVAQVRVPVRAGLRFHFSNAAQATRVVPAGELQSKSAIAYGPHFASFVAPEGTKLELAVPKSFCQFSQELGGWRPVAVSMAVAVPGLPEPIVSRPVTVRCGNYLKDVEEMRQSYFGACVPTQSGCDTTGGASACSPVRGQCNILPTCSACQDEDCCSRLGFLRSTIDYPKCTPMPATASTGFVCRGATREVLDAQRVQELIDDSGALNLTQLQPADGSGVDLDFGDSESLGSFSLEIHGGSSGSSSGDGEDEDEPHVRLGRLRLGCFVNCTSTDAAGAGSTAGSVAGAADNSTATATRTRQVVRVRDRASFSDRVELGEGSELVLDNDVDIENDLDVSRGASLTLNGRKLSSGTAGRRSSARVSGDVKIRDESSLDGVSLEVEEGGSAKMDRDDAKLRLKRGANITVAEGATFELGGSGATIEADADDEEAAVTNEGRFVVRGRRNATQRIGRTGREPAPVDSRLAPPVASINATLRNKGELAVSEGRVVLGGGLDSEGSVRVEDGGVLQLSGGSATFRSAARKANATTASGAPQEEEADALQVNGTVRVDAGVEVVMETPLRSSGRIVTAPGAKLSLRRGESSIRRRQSVDAGTNETATTAAERLWASRGSELSDSTAQRLEAVLADAASQGLESDAALDAVAERLRRLGVRNVSRPFTGGEHSEGVEAGAETTSPAALLQELAERLTDEQAALRLGAWLVEGVFEAAAATGSSGARRALQEDGDAATQALREELTQLLHDDAVRALVATAVDNGWSFPDAVEASEASRRLLAAGVVFATNGRVPAQEALGKVPVDVALRVAALGNSLRSNKASDLLTAVRRAVRAPKLSRQQAADRVRRAAAWAVHAAGLKAMAARLRNATAMPLLPAMLVARDAAQLVRDAQLSAAGLVSSGSVEVAAGSSLVVEASAVIEEALTVAENSTVVYQPEPVYAWTTAEVETERNETQVVEVVVLEEQIFEVFNATLFGGELVAGGNGTLQTGTLDVQEGSVAIGEDAKVSMFSDEADLSGLFAPPPGDATSTAPTARRLAARQLASQTSTVVIDGTLDGSGTVQADAVVVSSTGVVAPGSGSGGIGSLSFSGSGEFQEGSQLLVDVSSASSYDTLKVTGDLTLNGAVAVTDATGAEPASAPVSAFSVTTGPAYTADLATAQFELVAAEGGGSPVTVGTATPTTTPTATPTTTPTLTATPTPSLTVGASPSNTPSTTPSATTTPSAVPPTTTATPTATATPTLSVGASPSNSAAPTTTATAVPTSTSTAVPSPSPAGVVVSGAPSAAATASAAPSTSTGPLGVAPETPADDEGGLSTTMLIGGAVVGVCVIGGGLAAWRFCRRPPARASKSTSGPLGFNSSPRNRYLPTAASPALGTPVGGPRTAGSAMMGATGSPLSFAGVNQMHHSMHMPGDGRVAIRPQRV